MPFSAVMYTPAARDPALAILAQPECAHGYGLTFHFNQTHQSQSVTVARVSTFQIPREAAWQQLAPGVWALAETSADAMPLVAARTAEHLARQSLRKVTGAKEQTAVPFAPC
jgi:hypothetical protein